LNTIRRTLSDWWWVLQAGTHLEEVELRGHCDCGHPICRGWLINFRGRTISVRQATYDRIRHLKGMPL
jgi:hypothetical protein